MNIFEKYKPKNYTDIVGNTKKYNKLLTLINIDKYGNYILCGKSGTGKSTFIEIFTKSRKHPVLKHNIENNIPSNLFSKTFVKKIIIVDNITHETSDKKIKNLMKVIENENNNNYVFILSTHKFKVFNNNNFNLISLQLPKESELESCILNILNNENIKYSDKSIDYIIKPLIKNYNNNIRELFHNINLIIGDKKSLKYTNDTKEYVKKNKKDKFYKNSFDIMNDVFKKRKTIREYEDMFYNEPFIVENYTFENCYKSNNNINDMVNLSLSISNGDILENNIGVNFSLKPYVCSMKYIKPVIISNYKNKRTFFPSCVSKQKKINNTNIFKDKRDNDDIEYFNYNIMDNYYINTINKSLDKQKKTTNKKQIKKQEENNITKKVKQKTIKKTAIKPENNIIKKEDKTNKIIKINYSKMKVDELRKIATEYGIPIKKTENNKKKFILKKDNILSLENYSNK